MEPKYGEAIKAGIIGGVILAGLELLSTLTTLLNLIKAEDIPTDANAVKAGVGMSLVVLGCALCFLYIVTLTGTGAIAIRMTKAMLRDLSDAVVTAAVAGAVAGLIWGVISIVFRILSDIISPNHATIASKLGTSAASGICGAICCLPVQIIIGIVLAIIGGAIYYGLTPKK
jgi:hypothetical protein